MAGNPTLSGSDPATAWFGVIVLGAVLLLSPALWNSFPLMFPDSGTYLAVAWGHEWMVDRSSFYGLAWKPFALRLDMAGLWLGLAAQTFVISAVLIVVARRLSIRPAQAMTILLLVALLTSLPWHAAQIMPDALSAATILLTWLAVTRAPTAPGTPLLWTAVVALTLAHLTHAGLVVGAAFGALVAQLLTGLPWADALRRLLAATLAVAAALGLQAAANGLILERWTPSPAGPVFLFARLHEDGVIQPWLERECPRGATPMLCRMAPSLPRDSQELLWGDDSPFEATIWTLEDPMWSLVDELERANSGAILHSPMVALASAASGTLSQLTTFAILDDECPQVCRAPTSALRGAFRDYRPALLPALDATPQVRGELPKAMLRALTTPIAALSLLLLPPLLVLALRRRDTVFASLSAAVLLALVANAGMAGALSDVHDRYQSRVVWLAPFLLLLFIARARLRPTPLAPAGQP